MVSIVLTAYNAETTIERAILSCINQTLKDIEIIIVNDFSNDNTLNIIQHYCNKDSRIKLINHNINKGAGLSRRSGIEHIKGDWMVFLDSDDYLKNDCLEVLLNNALQSNVDIVCPGYIKVSSNEKILEIKIPKEKIIQSGKQKFQNNLEDTKHFMNPMLVKSSIWKNVTYSSRRFIEDIPTLIQILYYAKSILLLNYTGYYYTQNKNSLIHSASQIKYKIFSLLSLKDMFIFFKSKGNNLSTTEFCIEYEKLLNLDIKDKEYELYKNELDELYDYYLTITK